jgi:hypothetical protein
LYIIFLYFKECYKKIIAFIPYKFSDHGEFNKIVQGDRWFYIEVTPLVGEKYRISSFTSKEMAEDYVKTQGIQAKNY